MGISRWVLFFPIVLFGAIVSAQTVILIGDSHSDFEGNRRGTFGFFSQHLKELSDAQTQKDFRVFAASSSRPDWWLDRTAKVSARWGYTQTSQLPSRVSCGRGVCVPKLSQIQKNIFPDLIIIEQGTNMFGLSDATNVQQITELAQLAQAHAKKCLWLGAPSADKKVYSQASQDKLWKLISSTAGKYCQVYDSRIGVPYSPDANHDGVHLGMAAAGRWAENVFTVVQRLFEIPAQ